MKKNMGDILTGEMSMVNNYCQPGIQRFCHRNNAWKSAFPSDFAICGP